MISKTAARLRSLGSAGLLLIGTAVPSEGFALGATTSPPRPQAGDATPAAETERLESAFRICVSLYHQPLAGALMRTISDSAERDAFAQAHPSAVRSLSIQREHGYSTATAELNGGFSVAGIPVRAIYASTCELDCPLAVWGLEFGALKPQQLKALQAWVRSAPSTHTDTHGDIKVQLGATSDGQTLLICDVSD
jgi:hypothetical protein